MGSFGIKELLIVLVIVALIFGTKRLSSMGKDLGGAVRGFRKAMDESPDDEKGTPPRLESSQPEADTHAKSHVDSQVDSKGSP